MRGTAQIRPSDDYFHLRSEDPRWNESGWFGFHVPERKITGWLYMYHRPNMNYTVAGVGIFDPSGEHTWDCLFHDWADTMPLREHAEMFDFSADNSFRVTCSEPLKSFMFGYSAEGLVLDLNWTAVMEPFHSGLEGGSEDWGTGMGSGHFEQGGRMTGSITLASLGGETIPIDCWSVRDRSWGPRRVTPATPRGVNPWGAAYGMSFFLSAVGTESASVDPVDGSVERVGSGYYSCGGQTVGIFDGTYRCLERGADGRPLRLVIEATDERGRPFKADGQCHNWLVWPGYPHMFQWWSLTEWHVDGLQAWGNIMEWLPAHLARRWLRAKAPTKAVLG